MPSYKYHKPDDVEALFKWLQSTEPYDRYKGALYLIVSSRSFWNNNVQEKELFEMLDKFILAKHKDYVFKEVVVPDGVVRKDQYGYMFG